MLVNPGGPTFLFSLVRYAVLSDNDERRKTMGKKMKHTPQSAKAKDTASRILKKDCRTCDNRREVRVALPRGPQGKTARQQYYEPQWVKCPDC